MKEGKMFPKTANRLKVRKQVTDIKYSLGIKKLLYTLTTSEKKEKLNCLGQLGCRHGFWFVQQHNSGRDQRGLMRLANFVGPFFQNDGIKRHQLAMDGHLSTRAGDLPIFLGILKNEQCYFQHFIREGTKASSPTTIFRQKFSPLVLNSCL